MKLKLTNTFIFIVCVLQSKSQSQFYVGKAPKTYGNINYVIGLRKSDSIKIWYITKDRKDGELYERFENEKLICLPTKGKNFIIEKVSKKIIYGSETKLHKTEKWKEISRKINIVNARKINKVYNDSILNILQIEIGIIFNNKMGDFKILDSLIVNSDIESFSAKYSEALFANLKYIRLELQEKKKYYENLISGKSTIDSVNFVNFLNNYSYSYYDHKIFYYFIKHNPKLFYLKKLNIDGIVGIDINCDKCFTKEERREMYCKLKPFKEISPNTLWIFERRGDLICN